MPVGYLGMQSVDIRPSVRLEPFSEADFERLIGWSATPEFLLQWAGPLFTHPLDHGQLAQYLAATRQVPPISLAYRSVDEASGRVVGHVEIGNIDGRNSSARLSRVLVGPKDLRGRGVGQQMVRAAMAVAFDELHLHRVDLFVFDFNHAAIACYERAGFQHEGILREARRHGDSYWNVCVMSILEHQWRSILCHRDS